jgi:hypothetical protein
MPRRDRAWGVMRGFRLQALYGDLASLFAQWRDAPLETVKHSTVIARKSIRNERRYLLK